MTKIDRYVLWQFLVMFVVCFCSLMGLFTIMDGFGSFDEFKTVAEQNKRSIFLVVGEYYGYRSLTFFDRTAGLLVLISASFTVHWILRYNELTALMAAGISQGRVLKPVLLACVVISMLAVFNREWVIPRLREKLSYNAQDMTGTMERRISPLYDNRTNIRLSGQGAYLDEREQRIRGPNFRLEGPLAKALGKSLIADNAYYIPPSPGRPGGYLLRGVKAPTRLAERRTAYLDQEPVVLMPRDTSWLDEDECFVVSDVRFEMLADQAGWRQLASTWEMIQGLRNPSYEFLGDVRVAIHSRIVQPLLDVTLIFLGLPLMLARNRNIFVSIGLSGALTTAFMATVLACQQLGSSLLISSAALAAWLPLMIFAPLAAFVAEPLVE